MANKQNDINENLRVYAPSRGNLAVDMNAIPATRIAKQQEPESHRNNKPRREHRSLLQLMREHKVLPRTVAVLSICAVMGVMLFVMSRYNAIAQGHSELNELSERIEMMQQQVEKANVDYLFAIDINAARDAARSAGMEYPNLSLGD